LPSGVSSLPVWAANLDHIVETLSVRFRSTVVAKSFLPSRTTSVVVVHTLAGAPALDVGGVPQFLHDRRFRIVRPNRDNGKNQA